MAGWRSEARGSWGGKGGRSRPARCGGMLSRSTVALGVPWSRLSPIVRWVVSGVVVAQVSLSSALMAPYLVMWVMGEVSPNSSRSCVSWFK